MTRLCKDCVFDSKNKLREIIKDIISCVINERIMLGQQLVVAEPPEQDVAKLKVENKKLKEDLDLFRKAHDNEQTQRRIFEQKLESIKSIVENCAAQGCCSSGCKYYEQCNGECESLILQIFEEAENYSYEV